MRKSVLSIIAATSLMASTMTGFAAGDEESREVFCIDGSGCYREGTPISEIPDYYSFENKGVPYQRIPHNTGNASNPRGGSGVSLPGLIEIPKAQH